MLTEPNSPVGLAVLAASAAVEYVFPPFPGDTVTLFGAILISARGWSFWAVYAAAVVGSVAGGLVAFRVGGAIARRRGADAARAVDRLVARFRRHGPWYLAVNRFVPGVRGLFFVAAGMAGMTWRQVVGYGALSAAAWNALVIAAGSAVGANLDRLQAWARTYAAVVWALLAVVAAVLATRWWLRRRRARSAAPR
ncbi:MAG: DedA family protein [Deltaproteobacteria bacterium]|nr:MAG: DedA family protein [Deltaproteobacteria bacterium]